jgi:acetyl-CoA carboxylase biotin carboxyl carrier protein
MDFNQIQELIRLVTKNKLSTFYLQEGDFKIIIRNQQSTAPIEPAATQITYPAQAATVFAAAPPPPAPSAEPAAERPAPVATKAEPASGLLQIKSPMVGTFYRSPSPDKPPLIKVGDDLEVGAKVCIIEAMKLFNEIESEIKGKVVKILVEDASPVEYDQPLFLVEPA